MRLTARYTPEVKRVLDSDETLVDAYRASPGICAELAEVEPLEEDAPDSWKGEQWPRLAQHSARCAAAVSEAATSRQ